MLVSLVQCFAWSARVMYLLAHVPTRTGTSCAVLRLDSTGNVPTCPWSYSYWCPHGYCTYLPVFVLVLVPLVQCFAWTARAMYLLACGRTGTGTSCAVLRLDSTGYVPMCPCLYSCTVFVQCFAWTAQAMYLLARGRTRTGTSGVVLRLDSTGYAPIVLVPLCSALLGQHGQCTYLPVVVLVLVPLVQCFAWTARAMYLCARACILVQCLCSASLGQHGQCTYLAVVVLVPVPLVQCFAWTARAMYPSARACILVQCFVMGNPSHVRILVFVLSRCTCSATPTDMDSLLLMPRDGFYVRCICAGCLYLT